MIRRMIAICMAALCLFACTQKKKSTEEDNNMTSRNELYLLIGSYNSETTPGMYVYKFDEENGTAKAVSEVNGILNPSYLTISPDEKYVYCVSENDGEAALANSFSFHKEDGTLKFLNSQQTHGGAPCYISVDQSGKHVVTANYSGGNISVFPVDQDGSLQPASQVIAFEGSGVDKERQQKPYLHCVVFSPDGKYLFADDLGTDQIYKFSVNEQAKDGDSIPFLKAGSPAAFKVEDGSGPRHLTFHPDGKYVYLINELSGKVTAFQYANGDMKDFQYVAADTTSGDGGKGSADIHLSPDGRFLYASNRLQADGIAIFSVDQNTGALTTIGYQLTGIHPRNFIITPNGKYLLVANRDSNNIQIFERDMESGLLNNTGIEIKLSKPVCLKFSK